MKTDYVVDTHLHLWDLTVSGYAWLPPDGPLRATFTADQARSALDAAAVATAVLVQAEDSEADTGFMLAQAQEHEWIVRVVGRVSLDDPYTAQRQLDRLQRQFRGVRHLVHDDPRDDFLELPAVRRSLALLAKRGLPFDLPDAWPRHLAGVAGLAAALPELTVVIDHLGKAPRDPEAFRAWLATMRDVAGRPNTVAKLSGLQSPGAPFTRDTARPAVEAALDLFGPERMMYGGDWPIPFGGYGHSWEILSTLFGELSETERPRVLSGTANAVYGAPERVR
jgi:L-fuconolactonase